MKEDEKSLTSTMEVATCRNIQQKRKRLSDSDQRETEISDQTICAFPLQYIVDEHIIEALHDISDDNIYLKIWLTYCKIPALKNTLRSIYHDHCYSDIPELGCSGLVRIPEPSHGDCDDTICDSELFYARINEPSSPLYPAQSSDVTDSNIMDCDTDCLCDCNDTNSTQVIHDNVNDTLLPSCIKQPSDEAKFHNKDCVKFSEYLQYYDEMTLQWLNAVHDMPHSKLKPRNLESKFWPSNTEPVCTAHGNLDFSPSKFLTPEYRRKPKKIEEISKEVPFFEAIPTSGLFELP